MVVARMLLAAVFATIAVPVLAAAELHTVQLDIRDGVFTPIELRVPAGKKIKIAIHNTGTTAAEFESVELRKEKVLAPGASSFVVIAPLRVGTYTFFDDFHLDMPKGRIVAH